MPYTTFSSLRILRVLYLLLVTASVVVIGLSCLLLLSQAVRNAANRNWTRNVNALVVGATYILILLFSLAFCLKRRISVRLRLASIPHSRVAVAKRDVPKAVHEFIEEEYLRACAISFESQPKVERRPGWGAPGTRHAGIRFRTTLLDTLPKIDAIARLILPSLPPLRPNVSPAHHLRFIKALITADEHGIDYLAEYSAGVQAARYGSQEMNDEEFSRAMEAAERIHSILMHYRMAAIDES